MASRCSWKGHGRLRDEPETKQLVLAQLTDVSGLWLESSLGQAGPGRIPGVNRDMELRCAVFVVQTLRCSCENVALQCSRVIDWLQAADTESSGGDNAG